MAGIKLPDAVSWYEGMRLTPQHFQQQTLRYESLPAYLLNVAHPLHWGVLRIESHLASMVLHISALEAVTPDGRCIELGKETQLSVDLTPYLTRAKGQGPHTISLAVKMLPVADSLAGRTAPMPEPVNSTSNDPGSLRTWRPKLDLVCGDAPAYDSDTLLPLLRYSGSAADLQADESYIAPTPRIERDTPLYRKVMGIAARLRERHDGFVEQFNSLNDVREQQQADQLQWKIAQLGAHLHELEALLHASVHPQQLYLKLCGLRGALGALAPRLKLAGVPAFDYRELGACFGGLCAMLDKLFDTLASGIHRRTFSADEGHRFHLPNAGLTPGSRFHLGLLIPIDKEEKEIVAWMGDARITLADQLDGLEHTRSSGLKSTPLDRKQGAVFEAGPGVALFELELPADQKAYFKPESELVISGPDYCWPDKIVLFETPAPSSTTAR